MSIVLDEGYHLITNKGIYFAQGKQISKNFAICEAADGTYSITHIETGARCGQTFKTVEEAYAAHKEVIKKTTRFIQTHKKEFEQNKKKHKKIYEKYMREGRIVEKG